MATMRDITFDFDGKTYTAPMSAYDATFIVLPDGTAISPNGWLESFPPKMAGGTVVTHIYGGLPPEDIAKHLGNAVLASVA